MIEQIPGGIVIYLDDDFNPVAKEQATQVKRIMDNGDISFGRLV